jgi:hypothetical protein
VIAQYLLRNFLVHTAVRLKRTVDQGANRLLIARLILGRGRRHAGQKHRQHQQKNQTTHTAPPFSETLPCHSSPSPNAG